MTKESLIFIRGKWEIAHEETTFGDKRQVWIRRDQSWICDVGSEEAIMPMPPKPKKDHDSYLRNLAASMGYRIVKLKERKAA